MGDRQGSYPLRPRERERDRDRDAFETYSHIPQPPPLLPPPPPVPSPFQEPPPRSQVRLRVPDSVIDDDGSDAHEGFNRHTHHKPQEVRDANIASDRPALRRRKSVDLEKKTSRQNEEFRQRRNELEAQEAGAMKHSEDLPRRVSRKSGMWDGDDRRYE